jgi:hypothetical protein
VRAISRRALRLVKSIVSIDVIVIYYLRSARAFMLCSIQRHRLIHVKRATALAGRARTAQALC